MTLFRSPAFTWGVILFAVLTMSLVGLLFTVPQYFQGVLGASAEGSGMRLLPIVAGLLVGLVAAAELSKTIGARLSIAGGFTLLSLALAIGATTSLRSGPVFSVAWTSLAGVGTGLTMATTAAAALSELSEEHAGIGSGALQALKNTGAPLGTAIFGSTIATVYRAHIHLHDLSIHDAVAARRSVFSGVAVAKKLHSMAVLRSVREAFIAGMDSALLVSAAVAVAGVAMALVFFPRGLGSARSLDRTL